MSYRHLTTTPRHTFRADLQGLRCLAVVGVLLFHLWPKRFLNGTLGVDIFFVISGYLMKSLSASTSTFRLGFFRDFYFRRLKRLLPLYVTALSCTLIASAVLLFSKDLQRTLREARFATTFVSNTYGIPKTGYFGPSTGFPLFLHTWSLSTEMQFYLICPFLLVLANKLSEVSATRSKVVIALVAAISAALQVYTRNNSTISYMSLPCRIYQFLIGFLAFDFCIGGEVTSKCRSLFSTVVLSMIILCMVASPTGYLAADRFLVTVLVFLVITAGHSKILDLGPLIWLGGCSYGVYLVHWPLFVLYKYVFGGSYIPGIGPRLIDGVVLLILSIRCGSSLERVVTQATTKYVKTLKDLLLALTFLYVVLGAAAFACWLRIQIVPEVSTVENVTVQPHGGRIYNNYLLDLSINLYENRSGSFAKWTNSQVIEWNRLSAASLLNGTCTNRPPKLPTTYRNGSVTNSFTYRCILEGEGDLEMVLLGNSWAAFMLFGVDYHFRKVFKRLTLIASNSCQVFTNALKPDEDPAMLNICDRMAEDVMPTLLGWERKIDILIFHIKIDIHQLRLNSFMNGLKEAGVQLVLPLVGQVNHTVVGLDYTILLKRRQDIAVPYSNYKNDDKHLIPAQRISQANCSICQPYMTERAYCDDIDDTCRFTDLEGRSLFIDGHHPTPYGSLILAAEIRKSYEIFKAKQINNKYV